MNHKSAECKGPGPIKLNPAVMRASKTSLGGG